MQGKIETHKSEVKFLRGELKDKRGLMRELTTPRRCSFSDSTNKHRVVLKNPSGNNKVKDDTVDVADDLKDPTPNQSYAENP